MTETHIRAGTHYGTHSEEAITGGMFTAITDKAEGGKQRSNAPENSWVTMETWASE